MDARFACPLGVLLPLLAGACGARATEEQRTSDDALAAAVSAGEFPRTTSVIAYQHGEKMYERYFGGTDAETLHDVRSVTKSLAALATGIALADGKLPSIEAPAFAYLADLRPFKHDEPAKAAITIGDLLMMSSALDCDDDVPASPGNEENMYEKTAWARWAVDLPLRAGYTRERAKESFAYCTAGVFLLGQILQRAVGQPIDRYIETRLFAPLGIDRVIWNRSPSGEVATSGQLRIRTRDLAKLGLLVLHGGRHAASSLVPAEWIDRMLTIQLRPNRTSDPRGELGYGYLMWQREYATPCGKVSGWYMSGNGGNRVVVLRDLDAVAVVTTVNFNTRGMHDQTTRLLEKHVFPRLRCPA
jgi:CubicO group peptidase (beta-lactamase class C family)